MNMDTQRITVMGVDLELDYPARMELIRLLASSSANGPTVLRVQTYKNHLDMKANVSIDGSLGVGVDVVGMAVRTDREVQA